MNFTDLIGLSVPDAEQKCKNAGFRMRVIKKDGEELIKTMDHRTDRINVEVVGGKVTAVDGVG